MVRLTLKKDFDASRLETGSLCLGHEEIRLLFNVGPLPGSGDSLIVETDGNVQAINSNDLVHDLEAYEVQKE